MADPVTLLLLGTAALGGIVGAAGQLKTGSDAAALQQQQAIYHAEVLRREALYERRNAWIAELNKLRLTQGFEDTLVEIGETGAHIIADQEVQASGSGFTTTSESFVRRRRDAQNRLDDNIRRVGFEYASQIQDQRIAKALAKEREQGLLDDAEASIRLGYRQASNTRTAAGFNAVSSLVSGASAYASVLGSSSRNPHRNA